MLPGIRIGPWTALAFAGLVLPLLAAPTTAFAAYQIAWWTVDCGSASNLAGGIYSLSGTVGQPDAQSPPVMGGGRFEMVGGFWPSVSATSCEPCDINCDGTVNLFDIDPFVALLSPPPPARCSPCAGDTNHNGTVNMFDIVPFVNCLMGP